MHTIYRPTFSLRFVTGSTWRSQRGRLQGLYDLPLEAGGNTSPHLPPSCGDKIECVTFPFSPLPSSSLLSLSRREAIPPQIQLQLAGLGERISVALEPRKYT